MDRLDGGEWKVIRIEPPAEPDRFDEECRRPGNQWLAAHPKGDPPSKYWRFSILDLSRGFQNRCGYTAMWDLNGTVDHFLSRNNHRHLSYEWSNFRYVSGWINSSKQAIDDQLLDPFRVRDDWFEVLSPSLVMRLTNCVPARVRRVAEFTLRRLELDDGDRIYAQRGIYYDEFLRNSHPVTWLEPFAPMLATAARRERVLARLRDKEGISVDETAAVCETSREHARRLLHSWVRAEHLRSRGRGRATRYGRR
jgi:hypothetical protein